MLEMYFPVQLFQSNLQGKNTVCFYTRDKFQIQDNPLLYYTYARDKHIFQNS
jgi:hypothetical protein